MQKRPKSSTTKIESKAELMFVISPFGITVIPLDVAIFALFEIPISSTYRNDPFYVKAGISGGASATRSAFQPVAGCWARPRYRDFAKTGGC
jgi:hypothetical protein